MLYLEKCWYDLSEGLIDQAEVTIDKVTDPMSLRIPRRVFFII